MTISSVYSPGWRSDVVLGGGQLHTLEVLRRAAGRDPNLAWHDEPPMRSFGRSPSTTHLHLHRLAALGVIGLQTQPGVRARFTLRPRSWKAAAPAKRALTLARMKVRQLVGGIRALFDPAQLALAHVDGRPPERPERPPQALIGVAPRFRGACDRCGGWEVVADGMWRDAKDRFVAGRKCVDHDACTRRQGQTS